MSCILHLEGKFLVGMTLSWERNGKQAGGLYPCASFGLFGNKGIKRLLMILSSWTKPSNPALCILL